MSINAAKSFKLGFQDKDISASLGSEVNDEIISSDGKTKTNYSEEYKVVYLMEMI